MAQIRPIVSIENVVTSATIHQALDLDDIQKKFPHAEYTPKQFPGLVFRLQKPKTTTLIFRTGKMVCSDSKSADMAKKAVDTMVEKLRAENIRIEKNAVTTVQNMVA